MDHRRRNEDTGRDPLDAPDFFHAVLDSFREFGFRGSLGEGRRSKATIPSADRNRPMFESWKRMDQVRYAHTRLWRDWRVRSGGAKGGSSFHKQSGEGPPTLTGSTSTKSSRRCTISATATTSQPKASAIRR